MWRRVEATTGGVKTGCVGSEMVAKVQIGGCVCGNDGRWS